MRRSNSFPGAVPNESASDALLARLTAQLRHPAVPSGPASSPSSDDEDSDTFAEDWAVADDASTPTRCVSTLSSMCTRVLLGACYTCLQTCILSNILVGLISPQTSRQLLCLSRDVQPVDIHAVTAAGLLEKFLGPSHDHSQDDLVSADGTLKRADVSQRPNHTWHGPNTSYAMSDQRTSASKVSTAAFRQSNLRTHKCFCARSGEV